MCTHRRGPATYTYPSRGQELQVKKSDRVLWSRGHRGAWGRPGKYTPTSWNLQGKGERAIPETKSGQATKCSIGSISSGAARCGMRGVKCDILSNTWLRPLIGCFSHRFVLTCCIRHGPPSILHRQCSGVPRRPSSAYDITSGSKVAFKE